MTDFPISKKPIPEINLREISIAEWRSMFETNQPDHDGDKTLAKASGMTIKDIRNLSIYDYRALVKAVLDKAGKPLENDEKN
jgi:hypothetical protein